MTKQILTVVQRERKNARRRERYQENRARELSINKAWADKNKNKRKADSAAHYARNKRLRAVQNAAWRAGHQERSNAIALRYRTRHPDRHRAAVAKWSAAHPEKVSAMNAVRRAMKTRIPISDLEIIKRWERKWRTLKRVRCYWCNGVFAGKDCHSDHITSVTPVAGALAGRHAIENLCISCPDCNRRKSNKPLSTWNASVVAPVLF